MRSHYSESHTPFIFGIFTAFKKPQLGEHRALDRKVGRVFDSHLRRGAFS